METTKELINRAIIALGFNLDSHNYDYANVISSCGMINNMPSLHKTKQGETKLYGNVNVLLQRVADLPISYHVSIGVNIKKKHCRTWDFKHEYIVPNTKLDVNNLESIKDTIWDAVRAHRNKMDNL